MWLAGECVAVLPALGTAQVPELPLKGDRKGLSAAQRFT